MLLNEEHSEEISRAHLALSSALCDSQASSDGNIEQVIFATRALWKEMFTKVCISAGYAIYV